LSNAVAERLGLVVQKLEQQVGSDGEEGRPEEQAARDAHDEQNVVGHLEHHDSAEEREEDLRESAEGYLLPAHAAERLNAESPQRHASGQPYQDHTRLGDVRECGVELQLLEHLTRSVELDSSHYLLHGRQSYEHTYLFGAMQKFTQLLLRRKSFYISNLFIIF